MSRFSSERRRWVRAATARLAGGSALGALEAPGALVGPLAAWLGAAAPQGAVAQTPAPTMATGPAPRIVASFSILADMVREVAPADFQVSSLVGPDADAHVFEPTPADAKRLAQADLVAVNGLGFEGWIERLVRASGYRGALVVASRGITARGEEAFAPVPGAASLASAGGVAASGAAGLAKVAAAPAPGRGHAHGPDPHAWQDLGLARRYVQNLADALAARWPARESEVRRRAADYSQRLAELDTRVRQWLGAVPRTERRVITSHDAFGYFAAAYGVDFLAPRGWTTTSEPSAAAVARLVRQIREQRVRAVFVENISDPRLIERIARETGARVGGTLFSDALSAPGGPAGTYLRLFEHNARTLAAALGS